jgi:hypothetical protein
VEPEVLTNDVDLIEEDSPQALFGPDVQLQLKEETEERGDVRRRRYSKARFKSDPDLYF